MQNNKTVLRLVPVFAALVAWAGCDSLFGKVEQAVTDEIKSEVLDQLVRATEAAGGEVEVVDAARGITMEITDAESELFGTKVIIQPNSLAKPDVNTALVIKGAGDFVAPSSTNSAAGPVAIIELTRLDNRKAAEIITAATVYMPYELDPDTELIPDPLSVAHFIEVGEGKNATRAWVELTDVVVDEEAQLIQGDTLSFSPFAAITGYRKVPGDLNSIYILVKGDADEPICEELIDTDKFDLEGSASVSLTAESGTTISTLFRSSVEIEDVTAAVSIDLDSDKLKVPSPGRVISKDKKVVSTTFALECGGETYVKQDPLVDNNVVKIATWETTESGETNCGGVDCTLTVGAGVLEIDAAFNIDDLKVTMTIRQAIDEFPWQFVD